jgi:hypothetical protein
MPTFLEILENLIVDEQDATVPEMIGALEICKHGLVASMFDDDDDGDDEEAEAEDCDDDDCGCPIAA